MEGMDTAVMSDTGTPSTVKTTITTTVIETAAHEDKSTLVVDVLIGEHPSRLADTPMYAHSHPLAVARDGGRCVVCGRTAAEAGPLETHHCPVERFAAEAGMVDWAELRRTVDVWYGVFARAKTYLDVNPTPPADIFEFVDSVDNLVTICKDHHVGKDEGIHAMDWPRWLCQMFGDKGDKYTPTEVLVHET